VIPPQAGTPSFYFLALDQGLTIDAKDKANLARFINHSCDPNCITQVWNVAGEPRAGIFAVRDIPAGEELSFDYHVRRRDLCVGSLLAKAHSCFFFSSLSLSFFF
jgi:SET domain-containing protein